MEIQQHTELDAFSSGETNLSCVATLIIKMQILRREIGINKTKVYTNFHQHIDLLKQAVQQKVIAIPPEIIKAKRKTFINACLYSFIYAER